jgi:hypothetical protein
MPHNWIQSQKSKNSCQEKGVVMIENSIEPVNTCLLMVHFLQDRPVKHDVKPEKCNYNKNNN